MQNLDVKDTIQNMKKTKLEIKKELEESITNGKRNKNTDMQEKVNECTTNEKNAVKVIQEFEEIIKSKNRYHVVSLLPSQIFQKFKEKEQFVSMVLKFSISKSTIMFKIVLSKLIANYPKIKNSSLSLYYFKKHLKTIGEVCKENAREFK